MPSESSTSAPAFLPSDLKGRTACVVIGLFFSITGGSVCKWLLTVPFRPTMFALYELSLAWFLFGVCTLLWGMFMPNWIRVLAQIVVAHFVIVIAALFVPFAFQVVVALLSGNV